MNEREPESELETIFRYGPSFVRSLLVARDRLLDDCRNRGGFNVMWPIESEGDRLVARGPDGQKMAFTLDSHSGELHLQGDERRFAPFCLWLGTLNAGTWDSVVSGPLRLPDEWRFSESVAWQEPAHALGPEDDTWLESDETIEADVGFVATYERSPTRRLRLELFAKAEREGHAIVELRFLDRDELFIDVTPQAKPRLIELGSLKQSPRSPQAARMIAALGDDDLVEGECGWDLPTDLHDVWSVEIVLRSLTPAEALSFTERAEAIPFLGNRTSGYSAKAWERTPHARNLRLSSRRGFLLCEAERRGRVERLARTDLTPFLSAPTGSPPEENLYDFIAFMLQTLDRAKDNPLLSEDPRHVGYVVRSFTNFVQQGLREESKSRVKPVARFGSNFSLEVASDKSAASTEDATPSFLDRLARALAAMKLSTYDALFERLEAEVAEWDAEQWHKELALRILRNRALCEDRELAAAVVPKFGELSDDQQKTALNTVGTTRRRLMSRIRERFEPYFDDGDDE